MRLVASNQQPDRGDSEQLRIEREARVAVYWGGMHPRESNVSLAVTDSLPVSMESVEREVQRREFDSLYAAAFNGWSFAPLIKSHKIIAGSPSVSGMFAIRPTRFA